MAKRLVMTKVENIFLLRPIQVSTPDVSTPGTEFNTFLVLRNNNNTLHNVLKHKLHGAHSLRS